MEDLLFFLSYYNELITLSLSVLTLLVSVIAVIIAITSSRSTAKQVDKQISEIKKLSQVQTDASCVQIAAELERLKMTICRLEDDLENAKLALEKLPEGEERKTAEYKVERIKTDIYNLKVLGDRFKHLELYMEQYLEKK